MTHSRGGWSLLCGLLVGCGTGTTFTPVGSPSARAVERDSESKSAEDVEVFTSLPKHMEYTEVGRLRIEKKSQFLPDSDPKVVQELRERAAEEGCDAIVMEESGRSSISIEESNFAGPEASCIMWTDKKTEKNAEKKEK
jgi:hypothetical protein